MVLPGLLISNGDINPPCRCLQRPAANGLRMFQSHCPGSTRDALPHPPARSENLFFSPAAPMEIEPTPCLPPGRYLETRGCSVGNSRREREGERDRERSKAAPCIAARRIVADGECDLRLKINCDLLSFPDTARSLACRGFASLCPFSICLSIREVSVVSSAGVDRNTKGGLTGFTLAPSMPATEKKTKFTL